jgi:hypothetical protein
LLESTSRYPSQKKKDKEKEKRRKKKLKNNLPFGRGRKIPRGQQRLWVNPKGDVSDENATCNGRKSTAHNLMALCARKILYKGFNKNGAFALTHKGGGSGADGFGS